MIKMDKEMEELRIDIIKSNIRIKTREKIKKLKDENSKIEKKIQKLEEKLQ